MFRDDSIETVYDLLLEEYLFILYSIRRHWFSTCFVLGCLLSFQILSHEIFTQMLRGHEDNNWLTLWFSMFARWCRPTLQTLFLHDLIYRMKKKSWNKFCGKEASLLLYMYVKYRIFTQNIYKIFVNFLRGILAFQKNDKSFARDLYQSNLSDKTRKTYNQINIILTHCQVNKIKNVTVCYSVLLLKKTKKMIKLNGNGEKGVLTRKNWYQKSNH